MIVCENLKNKGPIRAQEKPRIAGFISLCVRKD
jgi:hypothetical protein